MNSMWHCNNVDNSYLIYMYNRGVAAQKLQYDIEVREFDFQSRYYIHFRTNTLGDGGKSLNFVGWLFRFYGISTFVGYLMPNPFVCKYIF